MGAGPHPELVDIEWLEPGPDPAPVPVVILEPRSVVRPVPRPAGPLTVFGSRYRAFRQEFLAGHRPRTQSRVSRVVRRPHAVTIGLLEHRLVARRDGDELRAGPGFVYDVRARAHRVPARLHVPWSFPDLPVWLAVEPWWRHQSVVSISLRRRARVRYPLRYYRTAHRAIETLLSPESGRSSGAQAAHRDTRASAPTR